MVHAKQGCQCHRVQDTLLLIQRALVLLGSASHRIALERRCIAWAKINKTLADGNYFCLFGLGFLEKVT